MKVVATKTPLFALGLGLVAGLFSGACRSSFADCDGSSGCACESTSDCLTGLTCIDSLCVDDSQTDSTGADGSETGSEASGDGDGDGSSSGDGDGEASSGDGDGDAETGDGDADASTGDGDGDGDATSGDGDGDGDASTGDGDGDATTGDGDGDGDTGAGLCSETVNIVVTANDAQLTLPFQLIPGNQVGESNNVAAESGVGGIAVFDMQVPCADTWYLWVRVRDAIAGVGSNDADALSVELGGDTSSWWYGCQTAGSSTPIDWLRVETGGDEAFCQLNDTNTYDLLPGVFQLTLENLEAGSSPGNAILVSRVMLTNDPRYVPSVND